MTEGSGDKTAAARSPNFGHLAAVDALLAHLGGKAERFVFDDPVTALFKLRQLAEVLAQHAAAFTGMYVSPEESQVDLLRRLRDGQIIDYEVADLFLYEQMMGRVTRLCPDIGKELFRIYDAVDLYAALQPYSAMKPVVTRPHLTFEQLVAELLTVDDRDHRQGVLDEIIAKLQIKKRRLKGKPLEAFETLAGQPPSEVIAVLKGRDTAKAIAFFTEHDGVAAFLDKLDPAGGRNVLVSEHADELLDTERGYGKVKKPEDYLAGFKAFIEENKNALDALMVVTQRPRDLSRRQLRELKLKLDQAGYSESALRMAWAQVSNQDIAASIIGFIRQQALGSPLVPYEQRVDRALRVILASQSWTTPQRKWLERIGKQLKVETIVDRDALDRGQFKEQGGFDRLNKVFGGKLEQVLGDLHEALWRDAG